MVENTRFCNTKDMRKYLALDFSHRADPSFSLSSESCPPWSEDKECLSVQAQMEEFMFLGLRMMRGVSAQSFACQFGKRIEEVYGTVIEKQLCGNLIRETAEGYCLTDYGIDVSNYVMSAYLFG